MDQLAETPKPPYYAVVFTSIRTQDDNGYSDTAQRMFELAADQPGFLGVESARDNALGITVSYWKDEKSIRAWKQHIEHLEAQRAGKEKWYARYSVRIAGVERAYSFES